jgi:hypothetical protein
MNPVFKAPGTERLKIKCDALLSDFALKFNLRHYIMEHRTLSKCAGIADELVDLAKAQEATSSAAAGAAGAAAAAASSAAFLLGPSAAANPPAAGAGAGTGAGAAVFDAAAAAAAAAAASDEDFAVIRLRGKIHQTNTETGRLAMEEPNLQNVPRVRAYTLSKQYTQSTQSQRRSPEHAVQGTERLLVGPGKRYCWPCHPMSVQPSYLECQMASHDVASKSLHGPSGGRSARHSGRRRGRC